ncbi:hypothetical protein [Oryzomonas rubra]|uniref:Uncharacterized protein n=1 Tax=Oryzomonas rubra TaxID=2509454 RepID=A0A5A9X6N3_9BACT|nr:hypothetical protein [Oryzomonas rubra]KAA0888757.1 hypothetical protein ET418_15365 [Oryzomonas rubra]
MVKDQTALKKAMAELDAIEKSVSGEQESEIDTLTKSLEDELGGAAAAQADLAKSTASDDDKGAEPEPENDSDADDDVEKSQQSAAFSEELVKASEMYATLTKSVQDGMDTTIGALDVIRKSLAASLNLQIKTAQVVGMLVKAMPDTDSLEGIKKSIDSLAGGAVIPNKAVLGMGEAEHIEKSEKTNSEVREALNKAVDEGRVAAGYLSVFGTYRDVNRLPEDVRKEIGF